MQRNGLIRKLWLVSKFMTPQTGHQIITIHILAKISRRKENQTMKFGQLIKYNMRNIFPEKSYTKSVGEVSLRPFHEKIKLSISPDQKSEMF